MGFRKLLSLPAVLHTLSPAMQAGPDLDHPSVQSLRQHIESGDAWAARRAFEELLAPLTHALEQARPAGLSGAAVLVSCRCCH
jgi:hypothetical protein